VKSLSGKILPSGECVGFRNVEKLHLLLNSMDNIIAMKVILELHLELALIVKKSMNDIIVMEKEETKWTK